MTSIQRPESETKFPARSRKCIARRQRRGQGTAQHLICAGLLMVLAFPCAAFEFITKAEAALPDAPQDGVRLSPYGKPTIKVFGDTSTTSPFDLVIHFEPGTKSAKIKLDSLQIYYLKKPKPVNLKPRIKHFIDSSQRVVVIRIEGAEAPPGKHRIQLRVEDSYERENTEVLNLEIHARQ